MGVKDFTDLEIYRISEQVADRIWGIVRAWDLVAQDTLGKQVIRSADSIGANLAEGMGRGSYQDHRRFIVIARGSLYETRHWLRRAHNRQLLSQADTSLLKGLIDELGPRLNAYLRSIHPPAS